MFLTRHLFSTFQITFTEQELKSMSKTFNNLITTKNLEEIKQTVDQLPTVTRKYLIYNCSSKKSMMFKACYAHATEIVEYFITGCKADINEVTKIGDETLTPLFIAIKTSNNDLINLLLKHGADMNWRDPEGRSAIIYACDINRMEAAYTLKNHGANINDNTNQNLCVKSLSYFKRALKLGTDVNCVDEKGETILMKAVSNSNIDIINLLLKEKADIYLRSYESGRNALDLAHFLEKEDVITCFEGNSVYSLVDKVISLELCGSLAILLHDDFDQGVSLWILSMGLYKKNWSTLKCLTRDNPALNKVLDLTMKDFDEKLSSCSNYIILALHVVCRIIEVNHRFIKRVFAKTAYNSNFLNKSLTFDDLKRLSKLNSTARMPTSSGVFLGMRGAVFMCDKQLKTYEDNDSLVLFIENIVILITEVFVPILKNMPTQLYIFQIYKHLLLMVLQLINILVNVESYVSERLDGSISKIARVYMNNYPTSMLLIAIERGFGFKTLLNLIAGGAHINDTDMLHNTPLHLLAEQSSNLPDKIKIHQLLLDVGGRIDATNDYGVKPRFSLTAK